LLHCISCQSCNQCDWQALELFQLRKRRFITNVDSPGNETEPESRREPVLPDQHRLDHVEHRHGIHLVAANDVDDDHHVGGGDEPPWPVQGDEDVLIDAVAEGLVADERDGEVAGGDDDVGDDDALPHGLLGQLPRRGRDGGLDLQHHVVPGVRERHLAQRAQEAEHLPRRGRGAQAVVDLRLRRLPLRRRRGPSNLCFVASHGHLPSIQYKFVFLFLTSNLLRFIKGKPQIHPIFSPIIDINFGMDSETNSVIFSTFCVVGSK
jgi:hypothetical protein